MNNCCYHMIISGRVQGVFFRASTRDQATRLGLTGWVRNRNDGDVELVACGDMKKIKQLEAWLWQGPKFAKVTEVKSEHMSENCKAQKHFEVRTD